VNWEPKAADIDEKLTELVYAWGDIEEEIEARALEGDNEAGFLSSVLSHAFRVEAVFDHNGWMDPCTFYVLLYDVADREARDAARDLEEHGGGLRRLILERARPWHTRDFLRIRTVAKSTPLESGEICRRLGQKHPPAILPSLEDVPTDHPASAVGLTGKDGYWLTPIEVPFYDALRETGLVFAVQPWIQGTDRRYRVDFLVFYGGEAIAVELDGHDWHKTKEQRSHDAERDRWFQARKVRTIRFTGSQVFADAQACVSELLNILRAAPAAP
jgi:very-short-patch-repair endonuclease